MRVEIINGEHVPPIPFFIVDAVGCHVDLSNVVGQLWDPTVARIDWGLQDAAGKTFGRVQLKNGQGRNFWDATLMQPYLEAFVKRWLEEKGKHAANVKARKDAAAKADAKRSSDDAMVRAIRAQLEQEFAR